MTGGIYRIINTYNNVVMLLRATDDIEKTISDFNNGVMPTRRLERYKFRDTLKIEIIETTESLAERYAFYKWPHLDRLSYSDECISKSLDEKFSTKILNVVDWLVDVFPDENFTFDLYIDGDELKADVYNCGVRCERYTFNNKKGEPTAREFELKE